MSLITTTEMKIGMTFPTKIVVFDTETTSPDPQECRLVSAFIGVMDTATGEFEEKWSWLVDPGVEIPAAAAAVHGITTEMARANGMDAATAIVEIVTRLDILDRRSLAIVVMNAPFDFTLIDREYHRYFPTGRPLMEPNEDGKITRPVVFDPMVLDRAFDIYRAGSRKLVDLCKVYGVPVEENAHDAEADCRMAGRVAIKLLGHSRLQEHTLSEVHALLIPTKRKQAASLAEFWKTKKLPRLRREAAAAARTNPVRAAELNTEIAELTKSINNVETVGHYWPMIPRPTEGTPE